MEPAADIVIRDVVENKNSTEADEVQDGGCGNEFA